MTKPNPGRSRAKKRLLKSHVRRCEPFHVKAANRPSSMLCQGIALIDMTWKTGKLSRLRT